MFCGFPLLKERRPLPVHFFALVSPEDTRAGKPVAPAKSCHTTLTKLLRGKPITPTLPLGWEDADDTAFYSREGRFTGIFANWVAEATSAAFVDA